MIQSIFVYHVSICVCHVSIMCLSCVYYVSVMCLSCVYYVSIMCLVCGHKHQVEEASQATAIMRSALQIAKLGISSKISNWHNLNNLRQEKRNM